MSKRQVKVFVDKLYFNLIISNKLSNLFASFGVVPIDGVLLPVLDVDILNYDCL
jgi:hypothetical protein